MPDTSAPAAPAPASTSTPLPARTTNPHSRPPDKPVRRSGTLTRMRRARFATFGLVIVAVVVVAAVFAPWLSPYDPLAIHPDDTLTGPSSQFWLGTDDLGRDVFSRLLYGARISLFVAVSSIALAFVVGTAIGLVAGYRGRLVDEVLMRLMDAIAAFPALLLALGITAVLGLGIRNVIFALAIVNVPTLARLVRAQVLSLRERDYVLAARALGLGVPRTLIRHLLPALAPALVVQCTIEVSHAVIAEASLSFLGVGARPPTPSWGSMLSSGFANLQDAPWLWIVPGMAIFLTVFSLNMVGDGVRIALDPRSRD